MAGMTKDVQKLIKKRNLEVIRLHKDGWSGTRIARRYGLSTQRVCEILRDAEAARWSIAAPKRREPRGACYPCGTEVDSLRISKPGEPPRPETCAGQGCYHTHCRAYRNYLVKFPDNQQGRIIAAPFNHANGGGSHTNAA